MDIRIIFKIVSITLIFNANYCFCQKDISGIKFIFTEEGVHTPISTACTPESFNWFNKLNFSIVKDPVFINQFTLYFTELKPDTSICAIDARIMAVITYSNLAQKDTLCFGEYHGIDLNGTFMKDNMELLLLIKKKIWPKSTIDSTKISPL